MKSKNKKTSPREFRDSINQPRALYAQSDPDKFRRRIALFKKSGVLGNTPDHILIQRATTLKQLKEAYELVHDIFVEQQYINPQRNNIRVRIFESLPETATYVAIVNQKIIGVMSLVPDSVDIGLPSESTFSREIGLLRSKNQTIGEITNLAIASEYRRSNIFAALTQALYAHALYCGMDHLFTAISASHAPFVECALQFDRWGEERNYSHEIEDLVVGMRFDINNALDRGRTVDTILGDQAFLFDFFRDGNPWIQRAPLEDALATKNFLTMKTLNKLFGGSDSILAKCTPQQLSGICRRWSPDLYAQVCFGLAANHAA